MRLSLFTYFLLLVKVVLCIPVDEIFTVDYQTVQTGIPFSSILLGDRLISLTNKNVLAIQNVTNGDVLYRYASEIPFTNQSSLIKIDNKFFGSSLVLEGGVSEITIWNVETFTTIKEELEISGNIIGLFSGGLKDNEPNVIAIDDIGNIHLISKERHELIRLKKASSIQDLKFRDAKYASSTQGSKLVILESQDGSTYYITIGSDNINSELRSFAKCKFSDLELTSGLNISAACLGSRAYEFDDGNGKFEISTSNYGSELVSLSSNVDGKIKKIVDSPYYFEQLENKVLIYDPISLSSKVVQKLNVSSSVNTGRITNMDILYDDRTNTFTVMTTRDDMIVEATHGNVTWERDESVSFPKDVVILGTDEKQYVLQQQLTLEKTSNILTAYINRFRSNIHRLLNTDFSRNANFGTNFGYLKKIVVLTENGKIAVYETSLNSTSSWKPKIITPQIKFDRLFKVDNSLIGVENNSFYHILLDDNSIIPCDPQFIQKNFKILDDLASDGVRVHKIIQTKEDNIYTAAVSQNRNSVIGYFMDRSSQSKTWRLSFLKNETFLSINSRSYGNDKVASPAVVLPDRKVLYKYLIPNIAAISSYNNATKEVVMRLTDIVTGKVYKTFTKETDNPKVVKILFEENFIIMLTQNTNSLDTEFTVIDMFESLTPDLKKTRVIDTFDSFGNITILPEWSSRSYLLQGVTVRDITLTYTKNNIASKWIIVSSEEGVITAIPKQILDGRRPLEAAKRGTAAGMMYQPYIIPADNLRLSHYRKLVSNSENHRLLSVPTELESTSVIVSVDTDLFTTRVRPSSSFDTISGSFKKKILVMTIISLILGIMYCKPLATQKKLKDIWRRN
ncbi:hypothetical protein HII12_002485 [Brettanomyces bruxellensis]|uniref:ER membrane protein complex subunit 1 n=1 Tax=Dekkera bruxellensis TaxID=5007 RepID=A0A7D9GZR3_DEKBR|nr:hypothetical protein HII12_002485 [Brettanomyces bruxellensis]VUG16249.1 DEBR0S1_11716g1_1 [Brettanomyces bruxellensis]